MAKAAAKIPSKTSSNKEPKKAVTARAKSSNIEQVSNDVLERLQSLGLDEQLQRDLQWCLGSYRADGNPIGLYGTAKKALIVFQEEKQKKTKGVTAKLIQDLEKIVKEYEG